MTRLHGARLGTEVKDIRAIRRCEGYLDELLRYIGGKMKLHGSAESDVIELLRGGGEQGFRRFAGQAVRRRRRYTVAAPYW